MRYWAKWMPKPSPAGLWLMAVFTSDQPTGFTDVMLRLDDGTDVKAVVDASMSYRVRAGVWACPTDERMTVKTVKPCGRCGQPSRLPMSAGGARHVCSSAAKTVKTSLVGAEEETLF